MKQTTIWIAIGPNYWGKGETPQAAIAQMRKAGFSGRVVGRAKVMRMPTGALDAFVNEMGDVNWSWHKDTPEDAKSNELNWEVYKGKVHA